MSDNKRPTARRVEAGFTLVELMVVIVIIGILAAIVVPKFMGATDDAKVKATIAQIHSFKTTLDMYKLKIGRYPSTSEGLEALINSEKGSFLDQSSIPPDPWGNPYVYTCPGSEGHDIEIISYGEDGAPGGADYAEDIKSWDLNKASRR